MFQVYKRKKEVKVSITCYGAGHEVGRSSILVEIGNKRILLDCGINIAATDDKGRKPSFTDDDIKNVDLVLVSHIHTDHLAAIPWLTEKRKCNAPVYMSRASFMMMPIMLDDFLKVSDDSLYTKEDLENSMKKINVVNFYERFEAVEGIWVQGFPAGHILGATAFYVKVHGMSFVYTGDFSAVSDHHLPGHLIPRLFPTALITESTYGGETRDSIIKREKSFVQLVHSAVAEGGKVLIPVFAVGRLQEICLMLEQYWTRMGYNDPIYYTTNLGDKAMDVYKQCATWMNPTVQTNFFDKNSATFKFRYSKNHKPKDPITTTGGFVMLATSGMLNPNTPSYNYFIGEKWYDDEKNLIIFPGYCGPGTVGRAILTRDPDTNVVTYTNKNAKPQINLEFTVKCKVERVSFSAHADQFEILSLCERVKPENVYTIHGDPKSVETLAKTVSEQCKINACAPVNGAEVFTDVKNPNQVLIERECVKFHLNQPSSCEGVLVKEQNTYKMMSIKNYEYAYGLSIKQMLLTRRVRLRPIESDEPLELEEIFRKRRQQITTSLKLIRVDYYPDRENENMFIAGNITITIQEPDLLVLKFNAPDKNTVNQFIITIQSQ